MSSIDVNLPLQNKLKHKITVESPDNLSSQLSRSNRKNKTTLKSYRTIHKDSNFFTPSSTVSTLGKDQKQMKTLVQSKIQQLHNKMKTFFNHERKTHLDQIAPEMQEIANSIMQLKEQLNRPKSMAQIQQEKHELLKKKAALLKEIQETNKKVKQNKEIFYQLKFQAESLDRQLKSGHATIIKYKQKLEANQSKIQDKKSMNSQEIDNANEKDQNMQKILNDSLTQQNVHSPIVCKNSNFPTGHTSIHEATHLSIPKQNDHVHITEVIGNVDKFIKKGHEDKQNRKGGETDENQCKVVQSHCNNEILKQKNEINKSKLNSDKPSKKSHHHMSGVLDRKLVKVCKKMNTANNSVEEYLKNGNLLQKICKKPENNPKYVKSTIKNTLEMSSELRKYEQIVNKQKWRKIATLFNELQTATPKHCLLPKNEDSNQSRRRRNMRHISDLQQLLMQELRREQFESYKEKGYHEGLKDKTHQIKIEMKRIFKNYSADEFFESIITKKAIKKQLGLILEDSFN